VICAFFEAQWNGNKTGQTMEGEEAKMTRYCLEKWPHIMRFVGFNDL